MLAGLRRRLGFALDVLLTLPGFALGYAWGSLSASFVSGRVFGEAAVLGTGEPDPDDDFGDDLADAFNHEPAPFPPGFDENQLDGED